MTAQAQELEMFMQKVNTAKQQMAQAQGSLATVMESLEKEFGITTIEQIDAKETTITAEIATLTAELETILGTIRQAFAEAGR